MTFRKLAVSAIVLAAMESGLAQPLTLGGTWSYGATPARPWAR